VMTNNMTTTSFIIDAIPAEGIGVVSSMTFVYMTSQ
jgi:hypothetical protein